jgi:hypothetical protein
MPATKKSPANGGWGITYADLGKAVEEYEVHCNCTIDFSTHFYQKYKKAGFRVWTVVCTARWARNTPREVCGIGTCDIGHGSGAASMPSGMLRALLSACDDLEARRASPHKAQEQARLPDFNA